jgi:hypothetical protein
MLADMKTLRPEKGSSLEAAIALLIQNEAQFLATERETRRELAQFSREIVKIEREMIEARHATEARFRRIEEQFEEQARVLQAHGALLEALPDAIQERIGFKAKK